MSEETVVYHYTPAQEGDFLLGVPRRDLTVLDVASLEPQALRDALSPGPSGKPMYTASKAQNEAAENGRAQQERYLAPFKAREAAEAKERADADAAAKAEAEAALKARQAEDARQKALDEAAAKAAEQDAQSQAGRRS